MIYLDTSYIVKCYLNEPGAEMILSWLEGQSGLSCCFHGRIEFFAAVQRHRREGRLKGSDVRRALAQLEFDERDNLWTWLPLSEALIRETCTRIADLPADVPLRSADALHLTCAVAHGFSVLYSHDRHLLQAAPHFGIEGRDILPS
jgi:predicted nucleic acid-binding protein